jgi:hypothetical protein
MPTSNISSVPMCADIVMSCSLNLDFNLEVVQMHHSSFSFLAGALKEENDFFVKAGY